MNKSENTGKLALALSKAQGTIKGAVKDSTNPFFRQKYADLTSVWDACREPLSKNELSVTQLTDVTEKGVAVETVLMHSSGEWISGRLDMPVVKHDPQGVGSAITYARRYALAAIVGISPEDDDAESAVERKEEKPKSEKYAPEEPAHRTPGRPITDGQRKLIYAKAKAAEIGEDEIKKAFKVDKLTDLAMGQVKEVLAWIDNPHDFGPVLADDAPF